MEINKKHLKITILLVIPLIIFFVLFIFILDSASPSNQQNTEEVNAEDLDNLLQDENMDNQTDEALDAEEFVAEDLIEGTGEEVKNGDTVKVNYTGTLLDGTQFDSSLDRGEPFEFTVGQGQVIQGWDEGLLGMKVGGKRKLTIPSSMGYGETGAGESIPPNAGLIFEIELVEIVKE
jgi:FKBP-type peptidyl-prolyl cis-trans isomerase